MTIDYQHWKLLQEMDGYGTRWQVLGYPELRPLVPQGFDASRIIAAGKDLAAAMQQAATPVGYVPVHPVYPRQHVRVMLNNSSVLLEPGAMHFSKGAIQMSIDGAGEAGGVAGFLKKAVSSAAAGESLVKPRFGGTGELFLEPRSYFLHLIRLNEEVFVCDKGLWLASDGSLIVDAQFNKFSGAAMGGEGAVQPRARGSGVVLIHSPVPREQILEIQLQNEELRVDGPFVMAYWGNIAFTAERAGKGLLSSAASGEGFVNVYRGTGTLWMNLVEAGCYSA